MYSKRQIFNQCNILFCSLYSELMISKRGWFPNSRYPLQCTQWMTDCYFCRYLDWNCCYNDGPASRFCLELQINKAPAWWEITNVAHACSDAVCVRIPQTKPICHFSFLCGMSLWKICGYLGSKVKFVFNRTIHRANRRLFSGQAVRSSDLSSDKLMNISFKGTYENSVL